MTLVSIIQFLKDFDLLSTQVIGIAVTVDGSKEDEVIGITVVLPDRSVSSGVQTLHPDTNQPVVWTILNGVPYWGCNGTNACHYKSYWLKEQKP